MSRYALWDKASPIYTYAGEVLQPEQWIARYGWINNPAAVPVVDGGIVNGGFCGELSQMKTHYTRMGADFTSCTTNEAVLAAIEAFEDQMNVASADVTTDERIASALEFLAVSALPDETA